MPGDRMPITNMVQTSREARMRHEARTGAIRCCCAIVGGGPAGMMLGFLLARAGLEVVVLEKHADFLRDFRGDTVHPSTLRVIDELGLLTTSSSARTNRRGRSPGRSASKGW